MTMKSLLFLSLCIVTALCFYDEFQHTSESCDNGLPVPRCFVTPCMLEENCTLFPEAECSNYYCKDNPCTTVWRYKGEIVDCGNVPEGWEDDWF